MLNFRTGTDDFKKLHDQGGYFVDKSLFIKAVLDSNDVMLLPRPRRFGKTLNMTMLRYFFEKHEEDRSDLFDGLAVSKDKEVMSHQGQYPVIYLSLKDVKGTRWEEAQSAIKEKLASLYSEHAYLCEKLSAVKKEEYLQVSQKTAESMNMKLSLKKLISYLYEYHKKPVIVLIDEYDSPVIEAWKNGFYDEMIDFMRNWLGAGLKHENAQALYRAVITGILRVAKESIFSGLNNLKVASMLLPGPFATAFGFTQEELDKVIVDFKMPKLAEPMREWYNGYDFGGHTIYNPWSVINCIEDHPAPLRAHWVNTSNNDLIHYELKRGGLRLKRDLEKLLAGKELRYPIEDTITFSELGKNPEHIWSFLFFSGYLKASDPQQDPDTYQTNYKLAIPNIEVLQVYRTFVQKHYQDELATDEVRELLQALKNDDVIEFERQLQQLVKGVFSFYDVAKHPEAIYHSFMLGILANLKGSYQVQSNVESGYGRADILMIPKHAGLSAKVIEFKSIKPEADLDKTAEAALKQIDEKAYATTLLEAEIAPEMICKLAIIVSGKQVKVLSA